MVVWLVVLMAAKMVASTVASWAEQMVASMALTMADAMVVWKEGKRVDLKDASTAVEMVQIMAAKMVV